MTRYKTIYSIKGNGATNLGETMKISIGKGSIFETEIEQDGAKIYLTNTSDTYITVHNDDLPALIEVLTKISKGE